MTPRPTDFAVDERATLSQFLDRQRELVVWKVAGLSKGELATPLSSSELTLGGLLKHLALVEDTWFTERFLGRAMPEPWASAPFDVDRDWEFHSALDDSPAELVELYATACKRSRDAVALVNSLDQLSIGTHPKRSEPWSLRWILLHMIEETARHAGHADLLREAIDGETGE